MELIYVYLFRNENMYKTSLDEGDNSVYCEHQKSVNHHLEKM